MKVSDEGRFETDTMKAVKPRHGYPRPEPARLEGRMAERGKLSCGTFESRTLRGTPSGDGDATAAQRAA